MLVQYKNSQFGVPSAAAYRVCFVGICTEPHLTAWSCIQYPENKTAPEGAESNQLHLSQNMNTIDGVDCRIQHFFVLGGAPSDPSTKSDEKTRTQNQALF